MKLGVVVLNWNGKDVTPRCLESLYRGTCPPDLVVVVDNASVDGSADLVRERFPQAELIRNDSNLGFAEGCNVGMRVLLDRGFELILLLNNDAVVDPGCLSELRRAAEHHPAAAYGATIYEMGEPTRIWYAGGTISRLTLDARHVLTAPTAGDEPRPTEFITGCCLMLRAEALRRIGFLDKDFFAYYEDVDWCLRAIAAGERLLYVPAAIVQHEVSHSFRKSGTHATARAPFSWMQSASLVLYLAYRNRLLLARKHAGSSLHLGFLMLRRLGRAKLHSLLLLLVGQGRQAKAIVDGSRDGLWRAQRPARVQRYLPPAKLAAAPSGEDARPGGTGAADTERMVRPKPVTVIVVNYNGGAFLRSCVEGLLNQTFRDFDVTIVDNGSSDGSIEQLPALPSNFQVVLAHRNLGFAAANNAAARKTTSPWIALLNPDAFPDPDWLDRLLDAAARYPQAGFFGSLQLDADDPTRIDGAGDVYHAFGIAWRADIGRPVSLSRQSEAETFGPCAAAAMYRRDDFLELGGFDERFFCYMEDIDLAFRLRLAGRQCVQVPTAVVRHKGSAIAGKGSDFNAYHNTRNGIWVYLKNMPLPLLLLSLPGFILTQLFYVLRAIQLGRYRPTVRGIRDALAEVDLVMVSRKRIQTTRRLSVLALAKMICWSPIKAARRSPHMWPVGARSSKRPV